MAETASWNGDAKQQQDRNMAMKQLGAGRNTVGSIIMLQASSATELGHVSSTVSGSQPAGTLHATNLVGGQPATGADGTEPLTAQMQRPFKLLASIGHRWARGLGELRKYFKHVPDLLSLQQHQEEGEEEEEVPRSPEQMVKALPSAVPFSARPPAAKRWGLRKAAPVPSMCSTPNRRHPINAQQQAATGTPASGAPAAAAAARETAAPTTPANGHIPLRQSQQQTFKLPLTTGSNLQCHFTVQGQPRRAVFEVMRKLGQGAQAQVVCVRLVEADPDTQMLLQGRRLALKVTPAFTKSAASNSTKHDTRVDICCAWYLLHAEYLWTRAARNITHVMPTFAFATITPYSSSASRTTRQQAAVAAAEAEAACRAAQPMDPRSFFTAGELDVEALADAAEAAAEASLPLLSTGMAFGIVMECAPLGDLAGLVQGRRMSPECCATIVRQICQGLHASHSAGVAHLDIKANNVMVSLAPAYAEDVQGEPVTHVPDDWLLGDGHHLECWLADFGCSGAYTSINEPVGTPSYICPALLEGRPVSPVSVDLWAVGMLVLVLMFGGNLGFSWLWVSAFSEAGANGVDAALAVLSKIYKPTPEMLDLPNIPYTNPSEFSYYKHYKPLSAEAKSFVKFCMVADMTDSTVADALNHSFLAQ